MKKLTNKKGFTLIEMLVVIAIIAILVAIIIPVVQSSTTKAAAATNAANLRAIKAEATTDLLGAADDDTGYVKFTASSKTFEVREGAPVSKACGNNCTAGQSASISLDGTGNVVVKYGNYDIDAFAKVAADGGELAVSGGQQGGNAGGNG